MVANNKANRIDISNGSFTSISSIKRLQKICKALLQLLNLVFSANKARPIFTSGRAGGCQSNSWCKHIIFASNCLELQMIDPLRPRIWSGWKSCLRPSYETHAFRHNGGANEGLFKPLGIKLPSMRGFQGITSFDLDNAENHESLKRLRA